ncbi:MAG: serine/threonine protein kinase, partial [candidate division Zixibacteria bacterium]|nr:serine/threonine protein kinase [candidate division Zixibacteria bacterium]
MNEQIGDYKILKKVGAGGMAQVFLGVHQDVPNLKVVLKVLSDPRLVERFRQEADKLALLDGHANICQIKHFFNHGAEIVIAMEYIEGTTLDEIVKGRGKLELYEALKITDDVLATLEFAHKKKIAHRDIKPSNIMIDDSSQTKIIDFGIAKAESDPDLTVAGAAVGTPSYMAPEQFTPTEKTNYDQIDIYAVGTTLYYLLTGELPFKGDNQFILREAKLFQDPTKPRDIDREIPKQVEDIILKALKRDPEERYKTASEMRAAIAKIPRDNQISGETEFVDEDGSQKSKGGKSPLMKQVSVVAFILMVIVASYIAFSPSDDEQLLIAPELLSPGNGSTLNTTTPEFIWQNTADEDGRYILALSNDSVFTNPWTITDLTANRFLMVDSLTDGVYFWQVQTVDGENAKSEFSSVFSFGIETAVAEIPQGSLELTIRPSGDIYIDGELYARNQKNVEIALDTGRYAIMVKNGRSNEKVLDETVTISAETQTTKQFRFSFPQVAQDKPVEPKPAVEQKEIFGHLSVGSKPVNGARVFINDRLQDHVTPFRFKLKAGQYVIRVQLTDGSELSKTDSVKIAADSTSKLIFE